MWGEEGIPAVYASVWVGRKPHALGFRNRDRGEVTCLDSELAAELSSEPT